MGNGNHYEQKMTTPCACCMQVFRWIPVIFIAAVIGWSYYAYVFELCIYSIDNVVEKSVYLVFYHIVLIIFLWSYERTIFTPTGKVPPDWRIPNAEIERLFRAENPGEQKRILNNFARNYPVNNRTLNGSVRFCEKCKLIKPDRAHHCSVCDTCILKMDHHCPWVNNCVSFTNYKFFVLFLGYALLYCLYVAATTFNNFIDFWKANEKGEITRMGRFHILFLFFVAIMFGISLVSLFGYHIYLVLTNRTTLEAFRAPIFRVGGPDKNGYNLGRLANFQEVFGDEWGYCFLPVFTSKGDGMTFPLSSTQQRLNRTQTIDYESMGATRQVPSPTAHNKRLDSLQPTDKLIIDLNTDNNVQHNHHAINNIQHQQYMPAIDLANQDTIVEIPLNADDFYYQDYDSAASLNNIDGAISKTPPPPHTSTKRNTTTKTAKVVNREYDNDDDNDNADVNFKMIIESVPYSHSSKTTTTTIIPSTSPNAVSTNDAFANDGAGSNGGDGVFINTHSCNAKRL